MIQHEILDLEAIYDMLGPEDSVILDEADKEYLSIIFEDFKTFLTSNNYLSFFDGSDFDVRLFYEEMVRIFPEVRKKCRKESRKIYQSLSKISSKYEELLSNMKLAKRQKVYWDPKIVSGFEEDQFEKDFTTDPKDLQLLAQEMLQFKIVESEKRPFVTSLAMKDHKSFMIFASDWSFRVIENGVQIHLGTLILSGENNPNNILSIIYLKQYNSYLFSTDGGEIWKKDIDDKKAYILIDQLRCPIFLSYSELDQKLIFSDNDNLIVCFDFSSKNKELEVSLPEGLVIEYFRPHGVGQNRVVSVTDKGHIYFVEFKYGKKQGEIIRVHSIELNEERRELVETAELSSDEKYLLVQIFDQPPIHSYSRIVVFSINDNSITLKAEVKKDSGPYLSGNSAISCVGYFQNNLVFVGLSPSFIREGFAQLYAYNTENEELEELEEARVSHGEVRPSRMVKLGSSFYYTGEKGKVMKLTVKPKSD